MLIEWCDVFTGLHGETQLAGPKYVKINISMRTPQKNTKLQN